MRVLDHLNQYFDRMVHAINVHGGVVDSARPLLEAAARHPDTQVKRFAARVQAEATRDPIAYAVRLAWQREPELTEKLLLSKHATEHGLGAMCRVLLNSNEFLYVD